MLFPMPLTGGLGLGGAVPEGIRNQAKWWWLLASAFMIVCTARFISLDVFGSLISGLMVFLVYYMLKDECKNLPRFVVMFGMLCAFNAFFELLPLMQALGGRVSRKVTPGQLHASTGKQTFSVTVETHPFFDPSQGWMYNLQSSAMIASPLCFLWGICLAQRAFRLLEPLDDGGVDPFGTAAGPPGGNFGGMGNFGATGTADQTPSGRPISVGNTQRDGFKAFDGQGHRLGG
eukprot:gnl/MRDRNA2_/MRDRNA2_102174_c0_seq1.p1 gnl/MRDRNA2_/MRDRNA2_102174_c0~~gnl/MRDRNA2_/MRDRNA2_102174_c0_seq1.p1  ORF type:complete len:232 (-),score=39.32 gnl/MRDRNA2_/MRDRNA2_102174_c0_seq1:112-807(-)